MVRPVFSVELEGQKLMLRLRKSADTPTVIEKSLNERNQPGLESDLSPKDLRELKETVGAVDVVLQLP